MNRTALELPRIFLLQTHLQPNELHELEDQIGAALTYDVDEAEIVLGRIFRRERALFELRRIKLETEPVGQSEVSISKRRKVSGESSVTVGDERHESTVQVLKLSWLKDSLSAGKVLPTFNYLLYEGRRVSSTATRATTKPQQIQPQLPPSSISRRQRPALIHQTTSEEDLPLPLIPSFLTTTFSCQRPTPVDSPNAGFAERLKDIRTIRLLNGDQVGVRAYSTSIATIAAYPFLLQSAKEVARLPGCSTKIAELWRQWKDSGQLKEAVEAGDDPMLSALQIFYDIWGVGDKTAREFYRKGWRDLDDLVEYGWESLSRVQQIGVKYYDEFKSKIPRDEAWRISELILHHARTIDPNIQMMVVGGYRRGKKFCGDVDVILSHTDENTTLNLVEKVVMVLEQAHLITHTLSLSTQNSERGQNPLPWKGEDRKGSGFDTLDKALVVWKDPDQEDAPHRRVDIIVSPWKTVGCAVLGWSGGTTFQRDLRRYCKKEKGLKFDSSGIRNRSNGMWVDIESSSTNGRAEDMESAERRVFEGLGLPYRQPEERCTG